MAIKKKFTIKKAKLIGDKLAVNWTDCDAKQFRMGLEVEQEHGKINPATNVTNDDLLTTGKIALAHLNEYPDYYERLQKMEHEAEKYWEKKRTLFLGRCRK